VGHVLVIGGGHGGFAAAADLARRGYEVALYTRTAETLQAVRAQGGIRFTGVMGEGFAPVGRATTDLADVVPEADAILVCLPGVAHPFVAERLAPLLTPERPVLLNPGGLLGSVAFLQALRRAGYRGPVILAETGTLTYICRKTDPGGIGVTGVLRRVPFAALPGRATPDVYARLRAIVPSLDPQPHILSAGFANVNAILHPPGMILAAAWIEHSGGDFSFYFDAATPAVARLMAAMDRERLAVARAWQITTPTFPELFAAIGSTSEAAAASGDYLQVLRDSVPNRLIKAPPSLDHRYLHEDIPVGLVPMADLGHVAGIPTPVLDAVVTIAGTVAGRDYRAEGRTLARVGLGGWDVERILQFLLDGRA
jgi:opine dehydrogenase